MTTSPSSGLSPEAKEFIPLVHNPAPSIPLYVDENTVASIYPSDQQPLMVQTIYPMMITTNSKVADNVPFPEIEFHIQSSQQQQFHIDSCTNISQTSSTNGNSSTNNTSQIVLLPTSNSATAVTPTGYYPGAQIIYSTNESLTGFYPMDYCEQPLINFSLQQPTHITKSNRILSQQQRPTSFRQQHGTYRPSSRGGGNRGNGNNNNNRNPYYDYNNRRNCSSYTRGHSSNSKRISSSYHSNDYNNYYHSSSSRSRGYISRSSHQQHNEHDEHRKDHLDYYNHEKDSYENDYQQSNQMNDDETPFEFRLEDFPSLPINNQPSDKTPSQSTLSTTTKPTSSWNEIVSAPRPRSTSPHSIPSIQDSRSDRSRSFNNKLSSNNERKPSTKKPLLQTTKSPNRASKITSQEDSPSLLNNDSLILENNNNQINDDGFIQTKQQHRRLKRRNKLKEEPIPFPEQSESVPYALDDENAFPTLGQQTSFKKSENDSNRLTDMFNTLSTSSAITTDSKFHKSIKGKRKEFEDNQKQQTLSNDIQNQTDTNTSNVVEEEIQNSNPLSSISSNNSSDTSDYDDAVDNLDDDE